MLQDVVLVQKREMEQKLTDRFISREVETVSLNDDRIMVIIGPRRAGKSCYAMHLAKQNGSFAYVNFDDERLINITDFDALLAAIDKIYRGTRTILLDEIQNIPSWQLLVNRLARQKYRLIITGSNAHLLSTELATHLTGRHKPIILFPFSFTESLQWQGADFTSGQRAQNLLNYLEHGGYPEPLVKGIDTREYLTTLFRSILYKDIVVRYKIRSPGGLEDLAIYTLTNVAREFSYHTLTEVTRCKSVHTVDKYLRYLEEAFLIFSVKRFSYKLKQQLSGPRKYYSIDNGMITACGFRFSSDRGRLYENMVALTLRKLEIEGKIQLYYWKSAQQEEVDFVVKKGLHFVTLIQVCIDPSSPKALLREPRALIKASKELRCNNLVMITDNLNFTQDHEWYGDSRTIRYISMEQWLQDALSQSMG